MTIKEMRALLKQAMSDMLQRNVLCDYTFIQDKKEIYRKNLLTLDAYLEACKLSKHGNVECYMTPDGVRAALPVFTVINGVVKLSGQQICVLKECE